MIQNRYHLEYILEFKSIRAVIVGCETTDPDRFIAHLGRLVEGGLVHPCYLDAVREYPRTELHSVLNLVRSRYVKPSPQILRAHLRSRSVLNCIIGNDIRDESSLRRFLVALTNRRLLDPCIQNAIALVPPSELQSAIEELHREYEPFPLPSGDTKC